jgi:hypothetical protein
LARCWWESINFLQKGIGKLNKKPLNKAERDWLLKLQAVLDECPSSRIGAYTIGDPMISIYDTRFESQINELTSSGNKDFCSAVAEVGAELGTLKTPFAVHSTAG